MEKSAKKTETTQPKLAPPIPTISIQPKITENKAQTIHSLWQTAQINMSGGQFAAAITNLTELVQLADEPQYHKYKIASLAWLSKCHAELKQYPQAKTTGEQAITFYDTVVCQQQSNKKLIAMSLYGDNPFYSEAAILNAQLIHQIYPDWTLAIYCDNSIPQHVISRLTYLNAEVINIQTLNASHMPGTFWRFLALERTDCKVVILRDADSLFNEREKILVDEWLATDKPFHIIRDWYGQTDLILAGLWGVRMGLLGNIRTLIEQYLAENPRLHSTHADQLFLAEKVWCRIKDFAIHHSSIYEYSQSQWPSQLNKVHTNEAGVIKPLGGWDVWTYYLESEGDYLLQLRQANKLFANYLLKNKREFELPLQYKQLIDKGEMTLSVFPIQISHQPAKH